VVVKLYAATPWGVQMIGSLADEPVGKVLFPGANRRFVDAELQRSFDEGDPGLPRFRSLRRGAVHA
jgi:hypothetical protein